MTWEVAGAVVECDDDDEDSYDTEILRVGRNGNVMFTLDKIELRRHEQLEKNKNRVRMYEEHMLARRSPWHDDPAVCEIEVICAQHKAELMHISLTPSRGVDKVKCFEMNGHLVQTVVWDDDEEVIDRDSWVVSQWVEIIEPPRTRSSLLCRRRSDHGS